MVWPSREPRGRQWPHCVAEVPLVSMTLPATETGRSKMAECREPCWCLSWFKQGSFDPFLEAAFLRGLISELGALKRRGSSAALRESNGARGGEGGEASVWEKKSEGVSLLSSCSSEVQLGLPRGETEMFDSSKSPGSSFCFKKLQEEKGKN